MSEFLKDTNREIEAAINAAPQNFEAIREATLDILSKRHQIERSTTGAFETRILKPMETDEPTPTGSGFKFEKEIKFAESTGKRALVIRANTPEDLAALERQVTR